jgi:hypothetical protein
MAKPYFLNKLVGHNTKEGRYEKRRYDYVGSWQWRESLP